MAFKYSIEELNHHLDYEIDMLNETLKIKEWAQILEWLSHEVIAFKKAMDGKGLVIRDVNIASAGNGTLKAEKAAL